MQPKNAAEQTLPAEATGIPEPLTVAGAVTPDRITLSLSSGDRDGVLRELVALVIEPQERRLAEKLFKALKAREDMCPTCIGESVAIPHARNAIVGLVDKPVLAYGRHPTGIDFGALDGLPVRHFFLLCAPNVRDHLHLLARLARLVHNSELRARLNTVRQPEEVRAVIQQTESKFTGPS